MYTLKRTSCVGASRPDDDDPARDLRITHYFTSTDFAQSLMLQQVVIITALAETALRNTPKSLVHPWSIRDAFTHSIPE